MRQTLAIAQRHIPLEVKEVPSGTPVWDWTVPREWNIRGAYVACRDGSRIADFTTNNLYVLQYSTPIDALIPLTELHPHLHTLPDTSDWIFPSDLPKTGVLPHPSAAFEFDGRALWGRDRL